MLDTAKTQLPCVNRVLIKTRGGRVLNKTRVLVLDAANIF